MVNWVKKGTQSWLFLIQKTHQVIFPALFELVITHIWHRNFDDDICTNGWCSSAKWESQKLLQKNIHICKDIQKVFLLFLHLYFYTNSWCFSVQQYLSLKRYSKSISCVFTFLYFYTPTAGVLPPNGRHRGCHKTIFIFVKIFKKYFFCFCFFISTHQRLVFFRPTAVTEAATKQYNWLSLAIHHGLSSGSSKLYFSFSANHISRYNSILEYSNIFCDFLVNSIIV